jgi:hypothetical protein
MDDESKRAKLQVISGGADNSNIAQRNTIKPGTVKSGKLPNRVAMRAVDRWHETLWSIADQSRNDSARVSALRELGKALGLTDGSGQDNAKRKPAKDILADIEAKLGKLTDKQASGK